MQGGPFSSREQPPCGVRWPKYWSPVSSTCLCRVASVPSLEGNKEGGHMSPTHEVETKPQYRQLLRDPLILLTLVIIVRFLLEAAGVPLEATRFLSVSVA